MSFLDQTYSFKNKELLTITKNVDTLLYSSVLRNSVLAVGEHNNLWFLLISLLVHHQNSPDTLPLI